MARRNAAVRCTACGHPCPQWVGQCPACGAWGSVEETPAGAATAPREAVARPLGQVSPTAAQRLHTGVGELDRVLGGGLVPGSIVVVGGEPGVGKSTLMLQVAGRVARDRAALYVTAEESAAQVRLRAERLGLADSRLLLAATDDLTQILDLVGAHRPAMAVIDSIQTIADPSMGAPGSVAQVRDGAVALAGAARASGSAVVAIGHVTKDGTLAGPRALEHLVDVVLAFDGDQHHALRLLRSTKNRFGSTGEVGCFTMEDGGLGEVADPSRLFVGGRTEGVPGSAVTVTIEGPRPLAAEVQALVASTQQTVPRRQVSGLDPARVQLLAAVLERRAGLALHGRDLFASVIGGARVREPAADLACCLAIASSATDRALRSALVAIGEVGLTGEVRTAAHLPRRLAEAARLGCRAAVVPASYDGPAHGLMLHRVHDVEAALRLALERPLRAA